MQGNIERSKLVQNSEVTPNPSLNLRDEIFWGELSKVLEKKSFQGAKNCLYRFSVKQQIVPNLNIRVKIYGNSPSGSIIKAELKIKMIHHCE